ncbi:hypothetical protein MTR67_052234 [Solanum verrucosum]|uniref:Uncharacterized protein n=1 Tax=Solanum verrucosum TaxID=315347 RepID=A0AAF1A3C9_SOLVR|nr:hypothetical protein MTR67_052234 [Solanum verrucosum]
MEMEASTHDLYEMMWSRVPVSYDVIMEASTHDLKGPALSIHTLVARFLVNQGSEALGLFIWATQRQRIENALAATTVAAAPRGKHAVVAPLVKVAPRGAYKMIEVKVMPLEEQNMPIKAATRGLDMRVATLGPFLGPGNSNKGLTKGFIRVSPVRIFRPLFRLQRVTRIGCYDCREIDHLSRDFPLRRQIALALPVAPLVRPGGQVQDRRGGHHSDWSCPYGSRSSGRSDGHGRGGMAHLYAALARMEVEATDKVITCMILLCHQPVSTLFDIGSNFSYLLVYYVSNLSMSLEPLASSLCVSIPRQPVKLQDLIHHTHKLQALGGTPATKRPPRQNKLHQLINELRALFR